MAGGSEWEVVDEDEDNVGPRVALHGADIKEGKEVGRLDMRALGGVGNGLGRMVEVVGDISGKG